MKKIFTILLFFTSISLICAEEIEVKFSDCVDGDTAKFIYNNEEKTARFLAIDTPETVHPTKKDEQWGKEASEFTCKKIKEAKKIVLEFDEESDRKDKYGRYLVWVFVDGNLLQEQLIENGLAEIAYLYGDYKYVDILESAEDKAKNNKIGIWENTINSENKVIVEYEEESKLITFVEKYKDYIILIGALIIVYMFNLKSKKRIQNKLRNKINKDIKKRLK